MVTLENSEQRLQLLPKFGGGIAAWDCKTADDEWTSLFRPWDGLSEDRYTFACFPLVPWSNRITGGGFEHDGAFYRIAPNRSGEPYPIHGDGWLQAWQVVDDLPDSIRLQLESRQFGGNPHEYLATQIFTLLPNGLAIELTVTNLGREQLPYGLGLHPYFPCNSVTRLRSRCAGVWLSGDDPIPIRHTAILPPTWNYNGAASLDGPLIDNCFTGWDGEAVIEYPDRKLILTMKMDDCNGYNLLYRPPGAGYFCLEPITHPIDAFHMRGKPGLAYLTTGETLSLKTTFTITPAATDSPAW